MTVRKTSMCRDLNDVLLAFFDVETDLESIEDNFLIEKLADVISYYFY